MYWIGHIFWDGFYARLKIGKNITVHGNIAVGVKEVDICPYTATLCEGRALCDS